MTIIELLVLSIGLAMDAFAVSLCKGLAINKYSIKTSIIVGLYFGIFQALMPLIGYFIGNSFGFLINNISYYIAFILLSIIGIKMIIESKNEENINDKLDFKEMLILSIATSIDALVVGITLSFLQVNLLFSIFIIGIVTFILTFSGVYFGFKVGKKLDFKAEILGGIILIIIGLKILLEHILW